MTLKEKLEYVVSIGWTANIKTGDIFNNKGKLIKTKRIGGYIDCRFYKDKKAYHLRGHHLIWFIATNNIPVNIDHINRVTNDNRLENLRDITHQKNMFNTNSRGACFIKDRNKWLSSIKIDGKHKHLGYFDSELEAHNAYLEAKIIYHII
jgi:hypothetical protein